MCTEGYFAVFAAGHADIEYKSWYLHGLASRGIEDRRYDVVISFSQSTPFALPGYAYLRL